MGGVICISEVIGLSPSNLDCGLARRNSKSLCQQDRERQTLDQLSYMCNFSKNIFEVEIRFMVARSGG